MIEEKDSTRDARCMVWEKVACVRNEREPSNSDGSRGFPGAVLSCLLRRGDRD